MGTIAFIFVCSVWGFLGVLIGWFIGLERRDAYRNKATRLEIMMKERDFQLKREKERNIWLRIKGARA